MVDPTGKIGRQVGWLNQNAGLHDRISYSDVVESLSAIDITSAMRILKDVEEGAAEIEHPTNYVWAAASHAFGGAQGEVRGSGFRKLAFVPNSEPHTDIEKRIAKQVGWLNQNVDLAERLSYSDVVGPLSLLDPSVAMKILKDLEEGADNIRNPTGYVASAAHRASDGGRQAESFNSTPQTDIEKRIAKQVGWLNQNVALAERLSYSDVVWPLSLLDPSVAMKILKDLEEGADNIRNPTGYVASAAHRAGAPTFMYSPVGGGSMGEGGVKRRWKATQTVWVPKVASAEQFVPAFPASRPANQFISAAPNSSPASDEGKKIAKQVGWINQNASLQVRISYSDVKEVLERCDVRQALKILKDIENQADSIRDPTAYVYAAAVRASSVKAEAPEDLGLDPKAISRRASDLGLELSDESLAQLGRIDPSEAAGLLRDAAGGGLAGQVVKHPDDYIAKACRRILSGPDSSKRTRQSF